MNDGVAHVRIHRSLDWLVHFSLASANTPTVHIVRRTGSAPVVKGMAMLYRFQFPSGPDVFMHQSLAEHLLAEAGKSPDRPGILTAQEMPAARDVAAQPRPPLLTFAAVDGLERGRRARHRLVVSQGAHHAS